jgi:LacI family transcriptional regulator
MKRTTKVSMRDLAKWAGVSPMTVSRALKNNPMISLATRSKIKDLAAEKGYFINPLVSAQMASIRSRRLIKYEATIALMIFTPPEGLWIGAKKIIDGVKQACAETGFKCDIFDLADKKLSIKLLNRMLKSRDIRVVIESPMIRDLSNYDIDFRNLIVVSSNPGSLPQTFHRVCPDHYGNMDMLLRKLYANGYRNPGLMLPKDIDRRTNHLWTSRYLAFQQTEQLGKIPPYMPETTTGFATEDFLDWFQTHKPDILIVTSQELFDKGFFEQTGIRIPEDIEAVKININDENKGFSGIDLMSNEVGAECVKLSSQLLYQNEFGIPEKPISIFIPGTWRNGKMCPTLE